MIVPTRIGAVVLATALGLAGCASIPVRSFTERGASFTAYRTYAWGAPDTWSTGDPRLDNNPFFSDQVRKSVDRELATRGFKKTGSDIPDVWLHYHASMTEEVTLGPGEYERCDNCRASVYDAGSLVIDVVDARTQKLVWRGWAERVNPVIDSQESMEAIIDRTIVRILQRLPPS